MMDAFRKSPAVRFWTRVVAVAVIGYLATFFTKVAADEFDAVAFAWGLGGAVASAVLYAIAGGTTPLEPFVGVNKTDIVVPAPPAVPTKP